MEVLILVGQIVLWVILCVLILFRAFCLIGFWNDAEHINGLKVMFDPFILPVPSRRMKFKVIKNGCGTYQLYFKSMWLQTFWLHDMESDDESVIIGHIKRQREKEESERMKRKKQDKTQHIEDLIKSEYL